MISGTLFVPSSLRHFDCADIMSRNAIARPVFLLRGFDAVTAPPDGIDVPGWDRNNLFWEAVMSEITTVGLDLAKNVFQVHGADARGGVVFRKKLRRAAALEFFSKLSPYLVAMEACGGAHFWGRELAQLGHDIRLIPPAYVKPFIKRQKNDAADAEAICEAAQRPNMRFVPVKSEETQGAASIFRVRELLIRQRTQAINALRGHLTEYGQAVPQGATNARRLIALVADDDPAPRRCDPHGADRGVDGPACQVHDAENARAHLR